MAAGQLRWHRRLCQHIAHRLGAERSVEQHGSSSEVATTATAEQRRWRRQRQPWSRCRQRRHRQLAAASRSPTSRMQYVGYPYAYAGEGPYAFDCSGFTKFVIQNTLGIDITHDMFTQIGMGQSVGMRRVAAGRPGLLCQHLPAGTVPCRHLHRRRAVRPRRERIDRGDQSAISILITTDRAGLAVRDSRNETDPRQRDPRGTRAGRRKRRR